MRPLPTLISTTFLALTLLLASACKKEKAPTIEPGEPFTDAEGNTYQTYKIGRQLWFAGNLKVSRFRNGDPIPEAKTADEWTRAAAERRPAWCIYEDNAVYGQQYGRLYNWWAVTDSRGLAPAGWAIPSDEDFTKLAAFLGGPAVAGAKMKATSGWQAGNGTNESGFNGLPGGYRQTDATFSSVGFYGYFWSTTQQDGDKAWSHYLFYNDDRLTRTNYQKGDGFSIRCIKQ